MVIRRTAKYVGCQLFAIDPWGVPLDQRVFSQSCLKNAMHARSILCDTQAVHDLGHSHNAVLFKNQLDLFWPKLGAGTF